MSAVLIFSSSLVAVVAAAAVAVVVVVVVVVNNKLYGTILEAYDEHAYSNISHYDCLASLRLMPVQMFADLLTSPISTYQYSASDNRLQDEALWNEFVG